MQPRQNNSAVNQGYGNQAFQAALMITLVGSNEDTERTLSNKLMHLMSERATDELRTLLTRTPELSCIQHKLGLPDLTQEQLDDALPKARTLIQERVEKVGSTLISNIEASMNAIAPATKLSAGKTNASQHDPSQTL